MSDENIHHIGIGAHTRRRNKLGKRAVACEVSERWLEFSETSEAIPGMGHMMVVSVMTDVSGSPKRLCDLTIRREDLLVALSNVKALRHR